MLSGNSLRQTVHTHRASVHQAAKLVAVLLRVAGVTAGLAESNVSLPPGLRLASPAGWLPTTGICSRTLHLVIEYGLPLPFFTCCCSQWWCWCVGWWCRWKMKKKKAVVATSDIVYWYRTSALEVSSDYFIQSIVLTVTTVELFCTYIGSSMSNTRKIDLAHCAPSLYASVSALMGPRRRWRPVQSFWT